jgi:hypothetical protein
MLPCESHPIAADYEVPEGLSMRELVDPSYDVDDESLF